MKREEQIERASYEFVKNNNVSPHDWELDTKDIVLQTFEMGAEWADENPKSPWISVKDDLPCNHKELVHSNYTDRVLVLSRRGYSEVAFMSLIGDVWEWDTPITVLYWMPIPELPKE